MLSLLHSRFRHPARNRNSSSVQPPNWGCSAQRQTEGKDTVPNHQHTLLYSCIILYFILFFFTPRSASNAFPVGLCHCNRQSAWMRWPLVHIFLHIRISTSKSLEFHKDSFFFETSNGCLPLKLLLCVSFFSACFAWNSASPSSLIGSKKSGRLAHYAHCLHIVELYLFFSSSKFRKAFCSCRKGGQVQQLLKLTT